MSIALMHSPTPFHLAGPYQEAYQPRWRPCIRVHCGKTGQFWWLRWSGQLGQVWTGVCLPGLSAGKMGGEIWQRAWGDRHRLLAWDVEGVWHDFWRHQDQHTLPKDARFNFVYWHKQQVKLFIIFYAIHMLYKYIQLCSNDIRENSVGNF